MTLEAFALFMRYCAQKRILFERTATTTEQNLLGWRKNWETLRATKDGDILPSISELEKELEDPEHGAEIVQASTRDVYYEQRAFLAPLRHFTGSRIFFRAESGNLGIAPASTRVGDRVCTVGGACTIFVIRKSSENPEMWELVGEAFMPWLRTENKIVDLFFQ